MAKIKKRKPTRLHPREDTPMDVSSLLAPVESRNPSIDVKQVMKEINKKFGEGAIVFAGERESVDNRPRVSWGSLALDYHLGGAAKGRINTISGDTGVGKSHLILKSIAAYQRMFPNETVALINSEDSYEESFAIEAGVDVDNLLIHEPDSLEEALNVARELQKQGVGAIYIDSIEALATDVDFEKDAGESKQLGIKPKMINDFTKIITNRNNRARREGRDGTTFFIVMQLRDKVGVVFGDPSFEPGGRSLQFMPHNKIRLIESNKEKSADKKTIIRSTITAQVTKSRQIGKGTSTFYYFNQHHPTQPVGIDHYEELIMIGIMEGFIVEEDKQNVTVLGELTCKRKELKDRLIEDTELLQRLYYQVMREIKIRMKHLSAEEENHEETLPDESKRVRGGSRTKSRKRS